MLSKDEIAQMTPEEQAAKLQELILEMGKHDPDEALRLAQKLNPNLVHPSVMDRRPMNRAERRSAKHRRAKK
ncbi:hypothetical protein LU11_gp088 [Pseudomonas phage Lu11]|uniref:hypothetical protein n=1 Tax=Pseudomonas phage Lu11 TaxID=1161927 RepID=UPI00025F1532|nr:hypothetical protein LU11_gp088 [Pseudomonas phage Lu11]AFH14619.1 hypothetical protein Lu11_0087 [Pseudomonas phage Lu11]